MKNKLQQTEETFSNQQTQQQVKEFGSVEELLRHDAVHTPVPPAIEHRLQESVSRLPAPPRSWWQRFFKK